MYWILNYKINGLIGLESIGPMGSYRKKRHPHGCRLCVGEECKGMTIW